MEKIQSSDKPPPEGAECRIQVDYLNNITKDRLFVGFNSMSGKFLKEPHRSKIRINIPSDQFHDNNVFIGEFHSHGKFIWGKFTSPLNNDTFYMMNSLGMSGSWTLDEMAHNHLQLIIRDPIKDRVYKLSFNDPRRFGNVKFTYDFKDIKDKIDELGINPLAKNIEDLNDVVKLFRKYNYKNICEVLMNQKVIAGVGNYVKCEALYERNFSPFKLVSDFHNGELKQLFVTCCNIIREAYKAQGASFKTFETGGERGSYSNNFKVYGRCKDPYGRPVYRTETPDGRTTHYCMNQVDYVAEYQAVTLD